MFNFFKKKESDVSNKDIEFELELNASILAYEIARSDGNISEDELDVLMEEIKKISKKVNKDTSEILKIIEIYSSKSVSFHEFIEDINKNYSKEKKLSLIEFLWKTAYADGSLEVNEERLVRRIAELIRIKPFEVLKIKSKTKT